MATLEARVIGMRHFVGGFLAGAALLSAVFMGPAPACADELVKFGSAHDSAGRPAEVAGAPIQGYLTKPRGVGPFPAIVLLHSCLGLPANRRSIGAMFANWGYVALFVDDFTTRGVKQTCATDFAEGAADAFGALVYLSKLPGVDAKRIAAVGYSQGADTALEIASNRFGSAFAVAGDLTFRAAVAFYPPCDNQSEARVDIPTLILIGAQDEVTPAADCERLARNQSRATSTFRLVVYPGARHLFNDPDLAPGRRLFGMWLQYDAKAAKQSKLDMREFLARVLGR